MPPGQASDARYRARSMWLDTYPGSLGPRPALEGDTDTDVAIVGGGFTGLWTAYYLRQLDPTLRVTVIERDICGFGASGRNGGWAIGELAAGIQKYAALADLPASLRLARAIFDSVDEIGRVTAAEGIECGYHKGGVIRWARNAPQAARQAAQVAHEHELGLNTDEIRLLSAEEACEYGRATGVLSGIFYAPCAAVDPARLVRGLSEAVERHGAKIHEQTAAVAIESGRLLTDRGTVRADVVVRATEAYTRDLRGRKRQLLPIYSLMIATEQLPRSVFDEIGLADRPTFADDRYMVIYGQRTADDRIAFGGRGVPYLYGSRISPSIEQHHRSHERIHRTLVDLFPALSKAQITHRWGGVLAVPRNWTPFVHFDRAAGTAGAGGYVGEGVAPSNLAGRTLADLICGADSERVGLPWVGVRHRRWEPEPFRWLGVRGSRWLMAGADMYEYRTNREARAAVALARKIRND
ncbi:MAG: FAD-binding oxidoreductase [Acidimicrobiaceae bacterium]|nr:FAD-binding oxidoreductase [Acidimicrobiaceae bacterium]MDE0495433.1 FAD-binding oxidoreductase [Acidimicrobiaceae bacterium]